MRQEDVERVRTFSRDFAVRLRLFDRSALGTEFSLVEGRVIIEIGRAERCLATDVSGTLALDKGQMSHVLARLEAKGIVIRSQDESDARRKVLSLSPAGRIAYDQLERRSDEQARAMLDGLGEDEVQAVLSGMAAIEAVLTRRGIGTGAAGAAATSPTGTITLGTNGAADACHIVEAYDRLDDVRELLGEYFEKEIGERRGFDVAFQHPEVELAELPGHFARPEGGLYLALVSGKPAGCIAFRRLEQNDRGVGRGCAEIKRLYVRPEFRGLHLGRRLLGHALGEARAAGYAWAYCDTDASMGEAIALYHSMGFSVTGAYYDNPLPGATYLRCNLAPSRE